MNLNIAELETLLRAVDRFGARHQTVKAMEELAELIQALSKYLDRPVPASSTGDGLRAGQPNDLALRPFGRSDRPDPAADHDPFVPSDAVERDQAAADHVAEEMADVAIMLEQLKIMLHNHARVDAWAHEKLARLRGQLIADGGGKP